MCKYLSFTLLIRGGGIGDPVKGVVHSQENVPRGCMGQHKAPLGVGCLCLAVQVEDFTGDLPIGGGCRLGHRPCTGTIKVP